MENINRIAKVGDIFERRDGQKAIYLGVDDKPSPYKYRFRLLDEHKLWIEHCEFYNSNQNPQNQLNPNDFLYRYTDIYHNTFHVKHGDYYVRFNGCSTQCSKWESPDDIIKKVEK